MTIGQALTWVFGALFVALATFLLTGCSVPKAASDSEHMLEIARINALSCPELRAEVPVRKAAVDGVAAYKSNPSNSISGGIPGIIKSYRMKKHDKQATDLQSLTHRLIQARCEEAPAVALERRIDHIEEKQNIEREERRHGELIDAIRGN